MYKKATPEGPPVSAFPLVSSPDDGDTKRPEPAAGGLLGTLGQLSREKLIQCYAQYRHENLLSSSKHTGLSLLSVGVSSSARVFCRDDGGWGSKDYLLLFGLLSHAKSSSAVPRVRQAQGSSRLAPLPHGRGEEETNEIRVRHLRDVHVGGVGVECVQ